MGPASLGATWRRGPRGGPAGAESRWLPLSTQALVLTAHLLFRLLTRGAGSATSPQTRTGRAHHQPSAPTSPQTEVSLCLWSRTSCALRSIEAPRGLLTEWSSSVSIYNFRSENRNTLTVIRYCVLTQRRIFMENVSSETEAIRSSTVFLFFSTTSLQLGSSLITQVAQPRKPHLGL